MENPFKNIIESHEAPQMLRDRVMDDIRLIKLSLDMADLFAVKYPSSLINLLETASGKKEDENKDKTEKN